jgi:Fe-S-cluster containining protein
MRKTVDGKCIFLRGNACAIYDVRPLICRFYPFELRNGGDDKYFFLATDECPRIGKGPTLTKQHFEELFTHFVTLMKKSS